MNSDILYFFDKHMEALPLYEAFERNVFSGIENVHIKVQKTQISFFNRHIFACVSFLPVRKKKDRSDSFIVITFGLDHQKESPRIDAATEAYRNRWTHHVLISKEEEIDEELMEWIKEAARFADSK